MSCDFFGDGSQTADISFNENPADECGGYTTTFTEYVPAVGQVGNCLDCYASSAQYSYDPVVTTQPTIAMSFFMKGFANDGISNAALPIFEYGGGLAIGVIITASGMVGLNVTGGSFDEIAIAPVIPEEFKLTTFSATFDGGGILIKSWYDGVESVDYLDASWASTEVGNLRLGMVDSPGGVDRYLDQVKIFTRELTDADRTLLENEALPTTETSIGLGTLPVDTFKLGSAQVDKIMLGDVEVWSASHLPSGLLANPEFATDLTGWTPTLASWDGSVCSGAGYTAMLEDTSASSTLSQTIVLQPGIYELRYEICDKTRSEGLSMVAAVLLQIADSLGEPVMTRNMALDIATIPASAVFEVFTTGDYTLEFGTYASARNDPQFISMDRIDLFNIPIEGIELPKMYSFGAPSQTTVALVGMHNSIFQVSLDGGVTRETYSMQTTLNISAASDVIVYSFAPVRFFSEEYCFTTLTIYGEGLSRSFSRLFVNFDNGAVGFEVIFVGEFGNSNFFAVFRNSYVADLDFSGVTLIPGSFVRCVSMFHTCNYLYEIPDIPFNIVEASSMFESCTILRNTGIFLGEIEDSSSMFAYSEDLHCIAGVTTATGAITSDMFLNCIALATPTTEEQALLTAGGYTYVNPDPCA